MASQRYKYRIVRCSSRFSRKFGDSSFTVSFSDDDLMHNVTSVSIINCTLAHVFYNITESNNRLQYVSSNILYTLDIEPGMYTTTQLTTIIENHYDINTGGTITFTQDTNTSKLSFVATIPLNIFTLPNSTIAPFLGHTEPFNNDVLNGSFANIPNLQGVQNIYVNCPEINQGNSLVSSATLYTNSILSIPVKVGYGSIITYDAHGSDFIDRFEYSKPIDMGSLTFTLYDENNNVLKYPPNHPFTLILKIYIT